MPGGCCSSGTCCHCAHGSVPACGIQRAGAPEPALGRGLGCGLGGGVPSGEPAGGEPSGEPAPGGSKDASPAKSTSMRCSATARRWPKREARPASASTAANLAAVPAASSWTTPSAAKNFCWRCTTKASSLPWSTCTCRLKAVNSLATPLTMAPSAASARPTSCCWSRPSVVRFVACSSKRASTSAFQAPNAATSSAGAAGTKRARANCRGLPGGVPATQALPAAP